MKFNFLAKCNRNYNRICKFTVDINIARQISYLLVRIVYLWELITTSRKMLEMSTACFETNVQQCHIAKCSCVSTANSLFSNVFSFRQVRWVFSNRHFLWEIPAVRSRVVWSLVIGKAKGHAQQSGHQTKNSCKKGVVFAVWNSQGTHCYILHKQHETIFIRRNIRDVLLVTTVSSLVQSSYATDHSSGRRQQPTNGGTASFVSAT